MSIYDGYRIYDRCPDSPMQKRLDEEAKEQSRIKKQCNSIIKQLKLANISATYFPGAGRDEGWIGFINHRPVTGYNPTKLSALNGILEYLKKLRANK